jgi:ABC-type dipeptide/oligopeptide/nickel transport system permease subunit
MTMTLKCILVITFIIAIFLGCTLGYIKGLRDSKKEEENE